VGFFNQSRGLGGEIIAVEPRELKRVAGVVDRRAYQRLGAFAHQAGIGTKDQHDGSRPIRPADEAIDLGALEGDHENFPRVPGLVPLAQKRSLTRPGNVSYVPAMK
jgi:hypothetical protein